MATLETDIRFIKGVGEARAKLMAKLGIKTLSDLVSYFPRTYDDRTVIKTIANAEIGETVCIRATAADNPQVQRIRRGLDLIKLRVFDERSLMNVTFFNQTYIKDSIKQGETYIFYGKVSGNERRKEMTNPVFEAEDRAGQSTARIVPVYGLTAGLSQKMLSSAVMQGLLACGDILPDPLPKGIQQEYNLAQSRFAYENIHFPGSFEELEIARRRLIFEEFFVLSCALNLMRGKRIRKEGRPIPCDNIDEFYNALPFSLTSAQKRAIEDIAGDMRGNMPMSRLVQGDVGSGKTVVAAAACYFAVKAGHQAAFMAPTEILAEQHYQTFEKLLIPLGIRVTLLTGSLRAKRKKEIYELIENGETDLVIGTHAVISDAVKFKDLALVVADEQHRFGVAQRTALKEKGKSAHMLVMSATPIPRTLALIIYGDLEVSIIDELPPGREPVDTFAVGEKMRHRIYNFIRKLIAEGRQAYIVCPMVEENELLGENIKPAKEYAEKLQKDIFPDLKVELIHGKLKVKEKEVVMSAFARGEIDVLVATTVIEVGVDVPNAALMVVENADRFGLSQLHQLRGRVGRGKKSEAKRS